MKFAVCLILCIVCIGCISAENSWQIVVTEADYEAHIENAAQQLVVIEFFAKWCGPCKLIAPFLEKLAPKYPNVVLLRSDIDESADLAERFAVAAMPTFFFVKSGEKVDQLIGANLAKLEITIIRLLEDAA